MMKRILAPAALFALMGVLLLAPGVLAAESLGTMKEIFPDDSLRKELSLILGKEDEETVTQDDADKVGSLMIKNKNILSMKGIGIFRNLTYLDLSSEALEVIPPEIAKLKGLRVLYLNDNKINTLPEEIGELEKLEVLSLSGNFLAMLPSSIGRLERLEQLVLNANRITALPPEIGELDELEVLILEENLLESLPDQFARLRSLSILDLGRNRLTAVPDVLGDLDGLYVADLSLNRIHRLDIRAYERISGLKGGYLYSQEFTENLSNQGLVGRDYKLRALDIYREDLGLEVEFLLGKPDGSMVPLSLEARSSQVVIPGESLDMEGTYTLKTIVRGGPAGGFGDVQKGTEGSVYRQNFQIAKTGTLPGISSNSLLVYGGIGILAALALVMAVRISRLRKGE